MLTTVSTPMSYDDCLLRIIIRISECVLMFGSLKYVGDKCGNVCVCVLDGTCINTWRCYFEGIVRTYSPLASELILVTIVEGSKTYSPLEKVPPYQKSFLIRAEEKKIAIKKRPSNFPRLKVRNMENGKRRKIEIPTTPKKTKRFSTPQRHASFVREWENSVSFRPHLVFLTPPIPYPPSPCYYPTLTHTLTDYNQSSSFRNPFDLVPLLSSSSLLFPSFPSLRLTKAIAPKGSPPSCPPFPQHCRPHQHHNPFVTLSRKKTLNY